MTRQIQDRVPEVLQWIETGRSAGKTLHNTVPEELRQYKSWVVSIFERESAHGLWGFATVPKDIVDGDPGSNLTMINHRDYPSPRLAQESVIGLIRRSIAADVEISFLPFLYAPGSNRGTGDPRWRSDHKLIKVITEAWGPRAGRMWQHLPCVDARDINVKKLDTPEFVAQNPRLDRLLWDDAIYDFSDPELGVWMWIRVATKEQYFAKSRTMSPWEYTDAARKIASAFGSTTPIESLLTIPEFSIVMEIFGNIPDGARPLHISSVPMPYYLDRGAPWEQLDEQLENVGEYLTNVVRHLSDQVQAEKMVRLSMAAGRDIAILLSYLTRCPEFIVEKRPLPKKGEKVRSAKDDKKPWTNPYCTRVLLIDPADTATIYPRAPSQGGSHASPRRHLRRGHHRHYKHPRFVNKRGITEWIDKTWVGTREWEHDGSRYRVINAEVTEGD